MQNETKSNAIAHMRNKSCQSYQIKRRRILTVYFFVITLFHN